MNWLGSPTASHSTPLMPETSRSFTCGACGAGRGRTRNRVITSSREQRRAALHAPAKLREVRHGGSQLARVGRSQSARASSIQAPPRFGVAGGLVQVDLADELAAALSQNSTAGFHGAWSGRMATPEQRLDDLE